MIVWSYTNWITMKSALVLGAGGFIGGHLAKNLIDEGHEIVGADIKPIEYWFQYFEKFLLFEKVCSNISFSHD